MFSFKNKETKIHYEIINDDNDSLINKIIAEETPKEKKEEILFEDKISIFVEFEIENKLVEEYLKQINNGIILLDKFISAKEKKETAQLEGNNEKIYLKFI